MKTVKELAQDAAHCLTSAPAVQQMRLGVHVYGRNPDAPAALVVRAHSLTDFATVVALMTGARWTEQARDLVEGVWMGVTVRVVAEVLPEVRHWEDASDRSWKERELAVLDADGKPVVTPERADAAIDIAHRMELVGAW